MLAQRPDPTEGTSVADAAPNQGAATALALSLANPEHPWLGLESFREETRAYFFGRDAEIAELHLRLRSLPLLVLYGRSGLGKTSILTAGLIPRLRAEQRHPLVLRLRYDELSHDLNDQLVAAVFGQVAGQGVPIPPATRPAEMRRLAENRGEYVLSSDAVVDSPSWTRHLAEELNLPLPEDAASRLWLRLHYRGEALPITHLILDQFEEVFTLGTRQPGVDEKVRNGLAILLQGSIPEPISRLIAEHESFLDHFDTDSVPVRVILALRDDYVYALNRWRRHLPALGQNTFELRALRGPAAFDAVFKPGELRCHYRGETGEESESTTGLPPIASKEIAQRIVRFVARKGEDVPIEEIEAVPPILSLLCRELNERRFTEPAGTPETPAEQITFREGDTDIETIISTFYERCLEGRPEAVRIFIEEELVSYSGARLAQDEQSILRVFNEGCDIPGAADHRRASGFGDLSAARSCLESLVNQRLLTSLGDDQNRNYELIHDLLAGVVEKSRTARKDRFEKEEAARRADAERTAKEKAEEATRVTRRRARTVVITVSAALAIAVLAAVIGFFQYRNAVAATKRATDALEQVKKAKTAADEAAKRATSALEQVKKEKSAAEELIRFMQYDLRDTLGKLGHLEMMRKINARIMKYYEDQPPEEGDVAALRERGEALGQQGDLFSAQGDLAGAIKSYRDALAIDEKLANLEPTKTLWQSDLAWRYRKVGLTLCSQGKLTEALAAIQNFKGILERLTAKDSGETHWQWNLAVSYGDIGSILLAQGRLAEALVAYQQYKGGMERLAKKDPMHPGWQRDLSNSYEKVGDVLREQGDLAGALKSYRDDLSIAEKLAKQDPSNANWQRDLSISYEKVGDVLRAQGDLAGALKNCRDEVAIWEKLAKQDPSNASWQRGLSIGYEKVGDVLRAQGDLAGALKNYRDEVAISEKLAKQDPSNTDSQRGLSVSYEKVGYLLSAQGDLAGALNSDRGCLAIREKLAKQDPSNAGWQSDLAYSYWFTGKTLARLDPHSQEEARSMIEKGRDILRQLKERTGLAAQQQGWLDSIETDLQKMQN